MVDTFSLAWALELKVRSRLSPSDPFAYGVAGRLPDEYRYDTLGKLVELPIGSSAATFAQATVARWTVLGGAWELFDLLNAEWQLRPHDFSQMADAMAFVTGDTDRPSAYGDLSANLGKCLLAARVRRAYHQQDELDLAEQWFVTGNEELTYNDRQGYPSLL